MVSPSHGWLPRERPAGISTSKCLKVVVPCLFRVLASGNGTAVCPVPCQTPGHQLLAAQPRFPILAALAQTTSPLAWMASHAPSPGPILTRSVPLNTALTPLFLCFKPPTSLYCLPRGVQTPEPGVRTHVPGPCRPGGRPATVASLEVPRLLVQGSVQTQSLTPLTSSDLPLFLLTAVGFQTSLPPRR